MKGQFTQQPANSKINSQSTSVNNTFGAITGLDLVGV
jgi:hypothetical protein